MPASRRRDLVIAARPANARTAGAGAGPSVTPPPSQERSRRARARQLLGEPLTERQARRARPGSLRPVGARAILLALLGAVSAVGAGLSLLQGAPLLAVTCALPLGALGGWALLQRRNAVAPAMTQPVPRPDEPALAALDALMARMAPDLPAPAVAQLGRLKAALGRCIDLLEALGTTGDAPLETSLYLTQAVQRYIPDSLLACERVPLQGRDRLPVAGTQTALDLLQSQLQMIEDQLARHEATLTCAAADGLVRQQRFLATQQSPMP